MRKSDTHLLQLKEIRDFIRALDRAIPAPGSDIKGLFNPGPPLDTDEVLRRAGLV